MPVQQRRHHNSYLSGKGSGLAHFAGHCGTGISDNDYNSHIIFSQCILCRITELEEALIKKKTNCLLLRVGERKMSHSMLLHVQSTLPKRVPCYRNFPKEDIMQLVPVR